MLARVCTRLSSVSIHAFRGEGDKDTPRESVKSPKFQSTPSGGKATSSGPPNGSTARVSIHAFRGEGDELPGLRSARERAFQSTPSGGKATPGYRCYSPRAIRFNPRLPGGRRRTSAILRSISLGFNPRLPGGRRLERQLTPLENQVFQSTPSGGKATYWEDVDQWGSRGFQSTPSGGKATSRPYSSRSQLRVSIHAFRGEGDVSAVDCTPPPYVSIHAFRGEGDTLNWWRWRESWRFQSTPSGGKAT